MKPKWKTTVVQLSGIIQCSSKWSRRSPTVLCRNRLIPCRTTPSGAKYSKYSSPRNPTAKLTYHLWLKLRFCVKVLLRENVATDLRAHRSYACVQILLSMPHAYVSYTKLLSYSKLTSIDRTYSCSFTTSSARAQTYVDGSSQFWGGNRTT